MRPLRILDCAPARRDLRFAPRLRIESRGRCASAPSAIRNPQSAIASTRPAFSLAELMIAIAILGIGLLMVASMFPIAWTKARDLARHTASVSCADTAEQTVRLVTRVDSAEPGKNYTSFAGDYLVETCTDATKAICVDPWPILSHDTLVHSLSTQNLLVTKPTSAPTPVISEEGWRLTAATTSWGRYDLYNPSDPERNYANFVQQWFGTKLDGTYSPSVALDQRVFPVMDPFPTPASASPTADEQQEIDAWTERMEGRRFCWAVFHRLTKLLDTDVPKNKTAPNFLADMFPARQRAASRVRVFDMYYVTLNRARGQRFARQDDTKLAVGEIKAFDCAPPLTPADVQFPSPWLVPLLMPEAEGLNKDHRFLNFRSDADAKAAGVPPAELGSVVPRGVPTEVLIEVDPGKSFDFRDFFQPGTQCIDALNGEIYRVVKRRLIDPPLTIDNDDRFKTVATSSKPLKAVLTLDRELLVEDLRANSPSPYDPVDNAALVSRQVWVFPPAIERTKPDEWAVVGPPPVAAIEVRPLVMTPQ